MNSTVKTVLFWLLIGVSALLLWEVVKGARDGQKDKEKNFTEFMSDVDAGHVLRELRALPRELEARRAALVHLPVARDERSSS